MLLYLKAGSSYAGGQWAAGDEPLYYIVSPKDVVIAKPRSVLLVFLVASTRYYHIFCSFQLQIRCICEVIFLLLVSG